MPRMIQLDDSKRFRPQARRGFWASIFMLLLFGGAWASNDPDRKYYVTDGTVNAVLHNGATVYIGGDFSYVGPNTGHGIGVNVSTAQAIALYPHIAGTGSNGIYAVVPDGAGGWYVGGDFSKVGTSAVANLVHINASRAVTAAFNPEPNGVVRALALSADKTTLYVGGEFTEIDGQPRNRLAQVNVADGSVTAWNPNATDGAVLALALDSSNDRLFAGGSFSSLGVDAAARGIAAFTASTGAVLSAGWATAAATNVAGEVRALVISANGATLYVGGSFSTIGGQARDNIAALTVADGAATTWTPEANGPVNALALNADGSQIYAAGEFTNIGGAARTRIARLNTGSNTADADWDHSANNTVSALLLAADLSRVHIGGDFTDVDGAPVYYHAALPTGTGANDLVRSDGPVRVLSRPADGPELFVGGEFQSVGGVLRNKVAALNISTGIPLTSWAPNIDDGAVEALALSYDNTEVFVGGSFTSVGSVARNRVAKFSASNGSLSDWAPNIENGAVRTMAMSTDGAQVLGLAVSPSNSAVVIAGTEDGLFRSTDGGSQWTEIDLGGTTQVSDIAFDPNSTSRVFVATRGRGVFVSSDNGATWQADNDGLTALQATSIAFSSDSSRVYVGTKFLTNEIGGLYRRDTGETAWTFARSTEVDTVAVDPSDRNYVYIGNTVGIFVTTDGGPTLLRADQGLAAKTAKHILVSNITDATTNNRVIYAASAGALYRTSNKGVTWTAFGRGLPGAALNRIALHPTNNDQLYVAAFGSGVYRTTAATNPTGASVTFSAVNAGLESLYTNTVAIDSANPQTLYVGASLGRLFKTTDAANWTAAETGIPHNLLYIGGDFTGSHPDYLAELNTVGTADYFRPWDAQPTAPVNAVQLSADGATLYAGGAFTSLGGNARLRLAALTRSTAAATTWAPSVDDGVVNALVLSSNESEIYLGGSFTSVNATTRNRLARIDTATGDLNAWDPGADGEVSSILLGTDDATLIASGAFTTIAGSARRHLASLLTSETAGTATSWQPDPDAPTAGRNALARLNNTIFVGGAFTRIGEMATRSFAGFTFTAPTVAATPRGSAFDTAQQITLTCTNSSGTTCTTIYFTTDTDLATAAWQTYTTPLDITNSVRLSFYGVDVEGSRSATRTETYTIDATGPTVTASPISGTYDVTQTVTLICDDGDGGTGDDITVAGCDTIFFTTDGSRPTYSVQRSGESGDLVFTEGSGTLVYSRAIPVVIDSHLRFIAVDSAGNLSSEGEARYSIVRVPGGSLGVGGVLVLLAGVIIRASRRASHGRCRQRR